MRVSGSVIYVLNDESLCVYRYGIRISFILIIIRYCTRSITSTYTDDCTLYIYDYVQYRLPTDIIHLDFD